MSALFAAPVPAAALSAVPDIIASADGPINGATSELIDTARMDLSHLAPGNSPDLPELRLDATAKPVIEELYQILEAGIAAHPRSAQTQIGPSDIGTDCPRRLMLQMAGHPKNRAEHPSDQWLSALGVAFHKQAAEWVIEQNARVRWVRYLVEWRVNSAEINGYGDLDGSVDVYDRLTGSVIDWKLIGKSSITAYRRQMRPGYKIQVNTYGLGWKRRGLPVHRVIVMGLPRGERNLRRGLAWAEDYDEQVALDALARAERVNTLRVILGTERAAEVTNGELLAAGVPQLADPATVTTSPEARAVPLVNDCHYCPYLAAGSHKLSRGCPGENPLAATPLGRPSWEAPPPLPSLPMGGN